MTSGYVARFYEANPAGDYWTFQWTDTAVLGGLAVLLTVVTVLLLRRRRSLTSSPYRLPHPSPGSPPLSRRSLRHARRRQVAERNCATTAPPSPTRPVTPCATQAASSRTFARAGRDAWLCLKHPDHVATTGP